MNSFKNVRELLFLSYVNNVVSDREFVLLYDAYQSKNPDFNYQQYEPFNLDNINSAECKAEFRIEKADLPRLAEALQLPPTFHCQQRTVFDSMEGLCMLSNTSLVFDAKLWWIYLIKLFSYRIPRISPADASFLEGKYITDNHFPEHQHVVFIGPLHRRST